MSTETQALERAIEAAGGTPYKLAQAVRQSKATVYNWVKAGRVSIEGARDVEEATGISRHDLRPDIFGARSNAD